MENWIDQLFNLYEKGRKEKKVPSGFIDYFEVRSFISDLLDNQKQSLLNKARKWQSENNSCMDCNGVNELIIFLDKSD